MIINASLICCVFPHSLQSRTYQCLNHLIALCAIEFEPEFLPSFKGIKVREQLDTRKKGKQKKIAQGRDQTCN
jgi:hypothetical protein